MHDILWDGSNPYPDTTHSYLIPFKYLRKIRAVFMLFAFSIICCEWMEEEYGFINFKFLTFWGKICIFIKKLYILNDYVVKFLYRILVFLIK